MKYFLDTYALIEIAVGNPAYKEYSQAETVTLHENVAEMYYFFILKLEKQAAHFFFDIFSKIVVDFPVTLVPQAMELRLHYRPSKKFSYIDCFGYTYALHEKLIFITGDRAFQELKNTKIIR